MLERYTPVLRRLERLRSSSLSGRTSVAQHDGIVALCRAGDVDGAATATRTNWRTHAPLIDDLADDLTDDLTDDACDADGTDRST